MKRNYRLWALAGLLALCLALSPLLLSAQTALPSSFMGLLGLMSQATGNLVTIVNTGFSAVIQAIGLLDNDLNNDINTITTNMKTTAKETDNLHAAIKNKPPSTGNCGYATSAGGLAAKSLNNMDILNGEWNPILDGVGSDVSPFSSALCGDSICNAQDLLIAYNLGENNDMYGTTAWTTCNNTPDPKFKYGHLDVTVALCQNVSIPMDSKRVAAELTQIKATCHTPASDTKPALVAAYFIARAMAPFAHYPAKAEMETLSSKAVADNMALSAIRVVSATEALKAILAYKTSISQADAPCPNQDQYDRADLQNSEFSQLLTQVPASYCLSNQLRDYAKIARNLVEINNVNTDGQGDGDYAHLHYLEALTQDNENRQQYMETLCHNAAIAVATLANIPKPSNLGTTRAVSQ